MVADGLVVASSGNISVRTGSDAFVVTAGGVPYHLLKPTDHPVVSTIDGTHTGLRKPTSELSLHLAIYRAMPDV
jgi:L-fuculose-phosphate aldolase